MQFLKINAKKKKIHNKYSMEILDKDGIYPCILLNFIFPFVK